MMLSISHSTNWCIEPPWHWHTTYGIANVCPQLQAMEGYATITRCVILNRIRDEHKES
jgi:hypothetical protein